MVVEPLLAVGVDPGEDGGLAGRWVCAPSRESQNQAVPEPPEDDLAAVVEGTKLGSGGLYLV